MRRPISTMFCTLLAAAAVSCSGGHPEATAPAAAHPHGFGEVMPEIGRHFERAGRAATAHRWELAQYDIDELQEVFDEDIPTAVPPPETHFDVHAVAAAFASTYPAELRTAAATHDAAAFATAFAHTAAACNSCHETAARRFIVVPSTPGEGVPVLTPL